MEKRVVSAMMLTLLLMISMLTLACNIQPVKADWTWTETIYILADGSVDPDTAPISTDDNVVYTLSDNISGNVPEYSTAIVVEKDDIILDGAGYTLQGTGGGTGMNITKRSNITVRNMRIQGFNLGINLSNSTNNSVSGNHITANSGWGGIRVGHCSNNSISGNNITANNWDGIILYESSNNTISGNHITANNDSGIVLWGSSNNSVSGNDIVENHYGISMWEASNNKFYHNNFIDNTEQVDIILPDFPNFWDDGYPSGGNYWSDYSGIDVKSGPYQDETGSDGIGDTVYAIDGNNIDNYPLMPKHDLVALLTAPAYIRIDSSSPLNATVTNQGSNDEANVEFLFLINGTIVDSTTIPLLQIGNSHRLSYLWTPTAGGTYNVTAYAHPVPGETSVENNQNTKFVTVVQVGVKAGDWIEYAYSYRESPETQYTEWVKVEFLSVEVTTVTMRGTIHLSNGTEQDEIFTVDIADDYAWMYAPVFDTLTGFVMLANSTVGDMARIGGTDGKPCARISTIRPAHCFGAEIDGETERSYVGTSRTVVYAKYSTYAIEYGPLTCYWDKQTGVLVEVCNTRSDGWTAKAAETNIWQAQQFGLPIDPTIFYALIIVAVAMLVAVAFFIIRRRKKRPEVIEPPKS